MPPDPDILVELTKTLTDFDAEVIAAALREEGIPATVFSRAAAVLQGQISPVSSIVLSVRRSDLDRAKAVLAEIRRSALEIDWSQVDTQDPTPVSAEEQAASSETCAACGYARHGLSPAQSCPECGRSPVESPSRIVSKHSRRRRIMRVGLILVILYLLYLILALVFNVSFF
jgi:hypothetical protein